MTPEAVSSDIVPVSHESDTGASRRAARRMADTAGFDSIAAEEVVLSASELASNLVKHAGGGTLTFSIVSSSERTGVMIESNDSGPGIRDVNQVLQDGFSSAGSLGNGLGAVNRLMDELDIKSGRETGTHIVCKKWVRAHAPYSGLCPYDIGSISRPRFLEAENGDAFIVKHGGNATLVGVIDGLGHGSKAHEASEAARDYVERHFDLPLDKIFQGTDRACRGTRGVVMALARFDWNADRIVTASVGNIDAKIYPVSRANCFEIRRGILGLNAPRPLVKESAWDADHILALYSDGLKQHWSWQDYPELPKKSAAEMAQALLRALGRDDDDTTVVVVRSALR